MCGNFWQIYLTKRYGKMVIFDGIKKRRKGRKKGGFGGGAVVLIDEKD